MRTHDNKVTCTGHVSPDSCCSSDYNNKHIFIVHNTIIHVHVQNTAIKPDNRSYTAQLPSIITSDFAQIYIDQNNKVISTPVLLDLEMLLYLGLPG